MGLLNVLLLLARRGSTVSLYLANVNDVLQHV